LYALDETNRTSEEIAQCAKTAGCTVPEYVRRSQGLRDRMAAVGVKPIKANWLVKPDLRVQKMPETKDLYWQSERADYAPHGGMVTTWQPELSDD
jgi:hypothetical protein